MRENGKDNVILIGMPTAGKSTAGVLLAKTIGYGFIDSDLLIQNAERSLLCDIIEREGAEGFLQIEDRINAELWAMRCVIATGGSVVYCARAMRHLKELGKVVYLKLSLKEIEKRLKNIERRGVVMKRRGETLADLYGERSPLYEKYADAAIDCDALDIEGTVKAVAETLGFSI